MSLVFILTFLVLLLCSTLVNGKKCLRSDFEYQYTECDKTGHRWLVSVPKINETCDVTSDFRVSKPARNCGEPCSPGTFLDVKSQDCKDCPSGTYSQGDIIEISNWQKLPPGFHTLSLDVNNVECRREEWIPKVDFISTTVSRCESFLTFTASLYKEGLLRFDYQMEVEGTLFIVKIVHDECLSKTGDKSNINTVNFLDPTSTWTSKIISLKKGRNVITWTVTGLDSESSTVKINHVRITNSIFSSQCSNCTAGYYSSKKSSICSPCSMNKYNAQPGSDQCKDCQDDHFSLPGSKSCLPKVKCMTSDYSYRWSDCDKQNQRRRIYMWIEPKLCSDSLPGADKLPPDSESLICEPCSKGTVLNESLQQCQFCPSGSKSLGSGDKCSKCSPNTKPVMTILYNKWSRPLPNLTFLCIEGVSGQCTRNKSWLYNGDHLQSSLLNDIHFLQLKFQTKDKTHNLYSTSKSTFSFDFSMHCYGYCVLHLFLKKEKKATIRLNTWINSTNRIEFRYHVPLNTPGKFVWYFSHNKDGLSSNKSQDHVKIYSIELTDLKDIGAIDCRDCDPKNLNNGCLDCDKDKYFSKDSHKCEPCPVGFILKNYPGLSINDCERCGSGLISVDGTTCLPKMTFISMLKHEYDLSNLNGHHLLRGNRLFNTHGQEYVHVFNVTLFTKHNRDLSFCKNNISSKDGVREVSSPMCRVTIVVDKSLNNTLYSIQTISLAEDFQRVEQSNSSIEYWKLMNDSLITNGFKGDNTGLDLHVHLSSNRKTDVCTKGRLTIITIRCDNTLTETQFLLPPKCPVETCDGCNFHFLLKSKNACPFCRLEDFNVITEECTGGIQKVHYQAASFCILKPGFLTTKEKNCPLLTMRTAIIVLPTIFILIFLICLVIYCYNKNKKLQYKYMRLISGNEDNENIMTGAESCAMNDGDEDDDDDVKIKTNSKSGKMFARFNKPSRNRKDDNDLETVNLNDNPEFDI